jgi:hypothetical protein
MLGAASAISLRAPAYRGSLQTAPDRIANSRVGDKKAAADHQDA